MKDTLMKAKIFPYQHNKKNRLSELSLQRSLSTLEDSITKKKINYLSNFYIRCCCIILIDGYFFKVSPTIKTIFCNMRVLRANHNFNWKNNIFHKQLDTYLVSVFFLVLMWITETIG